MTLSVFDFRDYLQFAEDTLMALDLAPCPFQNPEAACRTVIVRAYYACAHCIANKLELRGIPPNRQKGEFHGSLQRNAKTLRHSALSQRFKNLRDWREECDYNSNLEVTADLARIAIEDAKYIFRVLDTLRP